MNVINNNEEIIMEELIRIGIISIPQEIGGCGATCYESKFSNLVKVIDHFAN